MRNIKRLLFPLIMILLIIGFSGCQLFIDTSLPEDGVYYCEELKIVTDFKVMNEEGYYHGTIMITDAETDTYKTVYPLIPQSTNRIKFVDPSDQDLCYAYGEYKNTNTQFIVTCDELDKEYVFVKTEYSSIDDFLENETKFQKNQT